MFDQGKKGKCDFTQAAGFGIGNSAASRKAENWQMSRLCGVICSSVDILM